MAGLDAVAAMIDRGRVVLVLPSIILTEILQTAIGEKDFLAFERFTQRSNVQIVDLNMVLARTGQQLRDSAKRQGLKLDSVDSIFIATGLHYGCRQVHTFDASMLRLSEKFSLNARAEKLVICRPGLSSGEDVPLPGISL